MNAAAEWVIRRPFWAIAVVVVALVLLLARCAGGGPGGEATTKEAPSPAGSSTGISAATATERPSASPVEAPASEVVAARFVQAWLADRESEKEWLAGIEPYATPVLYRAYARTPPGSGAIPAARAVGVQVLLDGPALDRYRIALDDGSAVQVDVIADGGDPLVSQILPERH